MIVLLFVIGIMLTMDIKLTIITTALVGFQFIRAHILSKKFKKTVRNIMNYRSVMSGFKIWGQFKKDGEVFTVPYVIKVP